MVCQINSITNQVHRVLCKCISSGVVNFRVILWLEVLRLECIPRRTVFPLLQRVHFPPLEHSHCLLSPLWTLNQALVPWDLHTAPPCFPGARQDKLGCHQQLYQLLRWHLLAACLQTLAGLVLIPCLGCGMNQQDMNTCSSKVLHNFYQVKTGQ